jgi:hypothetical protein
MLIAGSGAARTNVSLAKLAKGWRLSLQRASRSRFGLGFVICIK